MKLKITKNGTTRYANFEHGTINGYVYAIRYKGVGEPDYIYDGIDGVDEVYDEYKESHRPCFNSAIVLKDFASNDDFVKEIGDGIEIEELIGTKYEKYLVKEGDNEGGLHVELYDQEAEEAAKAKEAEERNDKAILDGKKDIDFVNGIFGLQLTCHIPNSIFEKIKCFATYHKGDDDDMEWADDMGYPFASKQELKGWFFSKEAVDKLLQCGYYVSYRGERIVVDLETTIAKVKAIDQKHREDIIARETRIWELKHELRCLYTPDPFSDEMTCEEVEGLNLKEGRVITIPILGVNGHDIYGGGKYIIEKDNKYYMILNNGMDGDDWSRNNFETGGAGAIAYPIQDNDRMKEIIEEANKL